MTKKILIASAFIIGGYFLIKKLLPKIKKANDVKIDLGESKSASDVFEEAKKESDKRKIERHNRRVLYGLYGLNLNKPRR